MARESGIRHALLRWVSSGPFELAFGDRVAVRERDGEWLGEVVVPSARLVEWPVQEGLPVVSRRVPDDEWPGPPSTTGSALLESLALPPELLAWQWPGAATRSAGLSPTAASDDEDALAAARGPVEDERADQEPGGEHGQHR